MEFRYQSIELCKSELLGSGSYGGVCKAKCDGLLCAAKIMHPTLFDLRDPGASSYLNKFREECHLLSLARHPNIVQYLATSIDPDTKLPVLLMELCDDSLTGFLERQSKDLAYFTQVNLCHDISLALVYLHSNGLIHRDLTGNNVLIVPGSRAKITDFGMSKLALLDPCLTTLTKCPGNLLYMSPEALDEARYTEKLDIFSFGVIIIQILTREFPNPTNRFCSVLSSGVQAAAEKEVVVVKQLVPERERRKGHLSLIPETNPLKPLSLNCLNVIEDSRPSAEHLSETLQGLKQLPGYSDSQHLASENRAVKQETMARNDTQITELQNEISEKDTEINGCRTFIRTLSMQLEESRDRVSSLSREVQAKENEITILKEAMEGMEMELVNVKEKLCDSEEIVSTMQESLMSATLEQPTQEKEIPPSEPEDLYSPAKEKNEVVGSPPERDIALVSPAEGAGGIQKEAMGEGTQKEAVNYPENVSDTVLLEHKPLAVFYKQARIPSEMKWSQGKNSPELIRRGSAVLHGNKAYIRPANSTKVYCYENIVGIQHWSELPENTNANSGLVVLSGLLTTVGGIDKGPTNCLLSLVKENWKKWVSRYPAMPTCRYNTACIATEDVLIVAGGQVQDGGLNIVEVMGIETKQWRTVASLPEKCWLMSPTMVDDRLYLAGGLVKYKPTKSAFSCSISSLLSSSALSSKMMSVFSDSRIWRKIRSLPVSRTTLVTFNDHILAIGGEDDSESSTADVFQYQFDTNSWSKINKLREKRSWSVAVTLPEERLMVVGGFTQSETVTSLVEVLDK